MIVYPDDVWIVTPPKCGTTWMQEIVWHIHTDVDLEKAQLNQFYRQGPYIFGFEAKLYTPSTLNIDLIQWHTQLIMCAENVKSWFKSWVFSFHFLSLHNAPYIELYVC